MYFASTFRRCLLLLFAKIDKFYTRLVTLTSSVFVLVCSSFLSVGLSVCCCCWFVLAVFEFCVLAVVCVELRKRGEVVMVKSALFSLTLKGEGRNLSELKRLACDWFRFPEKEQGCCIRERGARWGRSLLVRDDDDDFLVDHCFSCVC